MSWYSITIPFPDEIYKEFGIRRLLILAIFFIPVLVHIFRTNFTRTARLLNKFSGGSIYPIIGNVGLFFGHPSELQGSISEYLKRHGRCCRFWKLSHPILMISDSSITERILSSQDHITKGDGYDSLECYFGQGLVTSHEAKWRKDRKELNAALKHQLFENFIEIFNKYAETLKETLVANFDGKSTKDLFPYLGNCTLGILCEAALGATTDELLDKQLLFNGIISGIKAIQVRLFKPWLTLPIIWDIFGMGKTDSEVMVPFKKEIVSYIEKKQDERRLRKTETDYDPPPLSFMDILLNSVIPRSSKDIYDHVVTIMGAGTDTAANCMNYTLYLLALSPEYQEKVHEELYEIFPTGINRNITMADLGKMKFLEMCIKESLRLFPPIPMFTRQIQFDVELDKERIIPKGATALFWPYEIHRDPKVYPNPETFQPERFSPEEVTKRNHYSYVPFSAGIRNCIGHRYAMLEIKLILAHILTTFEVRTTKPRKDLKVIYGSVLEPHEGIPLSLKIRN